MGWTIIAPGDRTRTGALAEQGVSEGDISELRILSLVVSIVEPSDADLNFLDTVEVWISADGLDDVRVASKEALPEATTELDVDLDDVDLAPYVLGQGLVVSTLATGEPPTERTTVLTTIEVEVGVTARGAWSQLSGL